MKSQLKCQVLGQGQFVMDLLMKRGCFYLVSLITLSECSVMRMINYNLLLVIEYQTIHKTSHHKLLIGEMKFTLLYEVMIKSLYFQMKRISWHKRLLLRSESGQDILLLQIMVLCTFLVKRKIKFIDTYSKMIKYCKLENWKFVDQLLLLLKAMSQNDNHWLYKHLNK